MKNNAPIKAAKTAGLAFLMSLILALVVSVPSLELTALALWLAGMSFLMGILAIILAAFAIIIYLES